MSTQWSVYVLLGRLSVDWVKAEHAVLPSDAMVSVGWVRKTGGPVFSDTWLCVGGVVPVGGGCGMALGMTPVGLGVR